MKKKFSKLEQDMDKIYQDYKKRQIYEDCVKNEKGNSSKSMLAQSKIRQWLTRLYNDLKSIKKFDKDKYKSLGCTYTQVKKILDNPSDLDGKEWKNLKQIYKKVKVLKQEIEDDLISDEDFIEGKIKGVKRTRINVRKGWWPL